MVTEKSINMGLVYATIGLTGTIVTYYGIKKYNAWKSAKNASSTDPQTRSGSAVFGGGGGGTTTSSDTSTTSEGTTNPTQSTPTPPTYSTKPAVASVTNNKQSQLIAVPSARIKPPALPTTNTRAINADGSTDKDMFDKFKQEVY